MLLAGVLLAALHGCSKDHTLACEPTDRYALATSTGPVQIPDDLSPPDESDSLRLPPVEAVKPTTGACLEAPPGFYAGGAVGGARGGTAAPAHPAPPPSRRRGRGAATPEATPPATDTAEKPVDKPTESSDREIGN
jgi:hypothetical protein